MRALKTKPKVGKLYKMYRYETADEFFKEIEKDNFHDRVFCTLSPEEKRELAFSILMLVKILPVGIIDLEESAAQFEFLVGNKKYKTAPLYSSKFGLLFCLITKENKNGNSEHEYITTRKTL